MCLLISLTQDEIKPWCTLSIWEMSLVEAMLACNEAALPRCSEMETVRTQLRRLKKAAGFRRGA